MRMKAIAHTTGSQKTRQVANGYTWFGFAVRSILVPCAIAPNGRNSSHLWTKFPGEESTYLPWWRYLCWLRSLEQWHQLPETLAIVGQPDLGRWAEI